MPPLPPHARRSRSSRARRHRSATTRHPIGGGNCMATPSLTATCAKHWRPTPTCAPLMPIFGAPALPCWSTARAVPCRPTWMHRARSPVPVATPRRRPRRSPMRWAFTSPIHWILQAASAAASKPPTPTRRLSLRHATRSAWSSLLLSPVPISRSAQAITRSLRPGRCWRYSAPRWRQPVAWPRAGAERTSMSAVPERRSTAARRRCRTCWRSARPHCSNWPR